MPKGQTQVRVVPQSPPRWRRSIARRIGIENWLVLAHRVRPQQPRGAGGARVDPVAIVPSNVSATPDQGQQPARGTRPGAQPQDSASWSGGVYGDGAAPSPLTVRSTCCQPFARPGARRLAGQRHKTRESRAPVLGDLSHRLRPVRLDPAACCWLQSMTTLSRERPSVTTNGASRSPTWNLSML